MSDKPETPETESPETSTKQEELPADQLDKVAGGLKTAEIAVTPIPIPKQINPELSQLTPEQLSSLIKSTTRS